jgi:hypothetical protein
VKAYGWTLRVVWVVLAVWLACSIGENAVDKQFQTAVLVLVIELLVLGIVEMVCYQIRLMRL